MTQEQKLEAWAAREFPRAIHNLIVDDKKGTVLAFGRYRIEQRAASVQLYVDEELRLNFSDRRSALSWCVADKHQQLNLARRISQLDEQKLLITNDIDTRRVLLQRSRNTRYRDTVSTKLAAKMRHRASVLDQLEKCITQAKYIQIRGFTNETARTRR
jgi:hypothetical protein